MLRPNDSSLNQLASFKDTRSGSATPFGSPHLASQGKPSPEPSGEKKEGPTWGEMATHGEKCNDWPRTVMTGGCLLVAFAPDKNTDNDDDSDEYKNSRWLDPDLRRYTSANFVWLGFGGKWNDTQMMSFSPILVAMFNAFDIYRDTLTTVRTILKISKHMSISGNWTIMVLFCKAVLFKWWEPIRKWSRLTMARMETDSDFNIEFCKA